MNTRISVVIATYNRPGLLIKCLDALAVQSIEKDLYEIIVVSDGPDETTRHAVDKWQRGKRAELRFFSLPFKKGPAAARNYGWLNAKGQLVAFTDDDCLPDKNWLAAYLARYDTDNQVAFTGKTIVPISARPTDYELNTTHLQTADFITANCCCSKIILEKVGGFDERFTMAWREDSDLEFRLIKEQVKIVKASDAIVVHPVRKPFWGISIKEQRKTMFNALLFKKFPDLYRQKIQAKPPLNYYAMLLAVLLMLAGIIFKFSALATGAFVTWMCLTVLFIIKRLRATSLSLTHVMEMVVTSLVIPFLSIFWQFYGAVKYRVLFF